MVEWVSHDDTQNWHGLRRIVLNFRSTLGLWCQGYIAQDDTVQDNAVNGYISEGYAALQPLLAPQGAITIDEDTRAKYELGR